MLHWQKHSIFSTAGAFLRNKCLCMTAQFVHHQSIYTAQYPKISTMQMSACASVDTLMPLLHVRHTEQQAGFGVSIRQHATRLDNLPELRP